MNRMMKRLHCHERRCPFWSWVFLAELGGSLGLGLSLTGCKADSVDARPPERVVQVVVADVKRESVAETLSLVGSVLANEMVEIKSETDGKIEKIHFQEGQEVKQGDLLIELDDTKLAAALAEAEANFKLSKANFERNKELFESHLISQQEFDQVGAIYQANQAGIDLKKRQLKDTRIYAPFDGVMGARSVSPGQVIARNTTLTWLVDQDPVKVEINVPERFLGQLKLGQTIAIKVAAYPDRSFAGKVFFIAPFVDPVMRTALVKALLPNPGRELVPGMFASLDLTLKIRDQSLVIPEAALSKLLDDEYAMLFVRDAAGTAQLKRVKIGTRLPGKVEILDGLKEGDTVIVEGIQKLAPGVKVNVGKEEPRPDKPNS
jgi:membrane fusion protein, multidrug efflux system